MKKWFLISFMLITLGLAVGCGSKTEEQNQTANDTVNDAEEAADTEGKTFSANTLQEKIAEENKGSLGEFTTVDIYGNEVTSEIFANYDLTLVNLFATWCGPCVSEMPELAQIHKDMREQGVNVVAVVLDTGVVGQIEEDVVADAQTLAEASEAEFTFLVPDATYLNGYLYNVSAVPESLIVDSEGKILASYVGARDYDAWMEVIETELANIQEAK